MNFHTTHQRPRKLSAVATEGHDQTRRSLCQSLVASLGAAALPGCVRRMRPICPGTPIWTDPHSELSIDVHSHFFNASDLHVKAFLSKVMVRQDSALAQLLGVAGGVLQSLGYHLAPSAIRESIALHHLTGALKSCPEDQVAEQIDRVREEQYKVFRQELQTKVASHKDILERTARSLTAESREVQLQAIIALTALPDTYKQLREPRSGEIGTLEKTFQSVLMFFVEMFQYRYASFTTYLETYSRAPGRSIDLSCGALVDFEWWLDPNRTTKSTLQDQVKLAGELAVATNGRLHHWAPFCPLREVLFRRDKSTFSALALVREAVEQHGAIGVKLYPPMGFKPMGNDRLRADFWTVASWLPPVTKLPTFGVLLDEVLTDLYSWCSNHGIPVLAHANASNGPNREFERLALADGWAQVLSSQLFPNLQVSFGHFGGAGDAIGLESSQAFLKLLADANGHYYADASYFSKALENRDKLEQFLEQLFDSEPSGARVLRERFLFGTDWKMLLAESRAGTYVAELNHIIQMLDSTFSDPATSLPKRFFGESPARFLGLGKGEKNRERLEDFYRRNDVSNVGWLHKTA